MTRPRILLIATLTLLLHATGALASWYDDYDKGLAAARSGQWQVVIQRMSAAIAGNGREADKAKTYGTIFISYHPYYYRAIAYMNTGKYEQAIADFEKTQGPGELDLGSLDTNMQRAKAKLEAASAAPQPAAAAPPPVKVAAAPEPAAPAAPAVDPALRQRVGAAIATANNSLAGARTRKATASPQYAQAIGALAEANTKLNTAKSNDDLNGALASAQNAVLFADAATAPGAPPSVVKTPPVTAASLVQPRATAAAEAALSDSHAAMRNALTSYFSGEFESASRSFEQLSRAMPTNGWVWAFLGASKYSQYAFEADETYKADAISAFKKAKSSPQFKRGLPDKYFSKRIRKFFDGLG